MLKTCIEQIIPCAYTVLGIESFILLSIVFKRPRALLSFMLTIVAFWNIGTCTGHRVDNGSLYLASENKLYTAIACLVCIGIYTLIETRSITKENAKRKAEAARRAEEEALERKEYNEQLECCREFEEFNMLYDFPVPRLQIMYNCGNNQKFKISNESLQKRLALEIGGMVKSRDSVQERLMHCYTFVKEVVLPNIDNTNLRQNVQHKMHDVITWLTATTVQCRVYYITPVRHEKHERYVNLCLVRSEPVTDSKTFAQEQRALVTPKIRFEVLKRDNFTCQYCGAHGDGVVLEVDHIIPISKGGTSDMGNLITACFDCNRGKGSNLVTNKQAM